MGDEEQIEKMARKIVVEMEYNPDSDWVNEGGEEVPLWRDYCVLARSVLAQLAEANKRVGELEAFIKKYAWPDDIPDELGLGKAQLTALEGE